MKGARDSKEESAVPNACVALEIESLCREFTHLGFYLHHTSWVRNLSPIPACQKHTYFSKQLTSVP